VLAGIDEAAAERILERRRTTAGAATGLEERDLEARIDERGRGRQPGEAGPDDDDLRRRRGRQVAGFSGFRSR
jgi:hypothetical protein